MKELTPEQIQSYHKIIPDPEGKNRGCIFIEKGPFAGITVAFEFADGVVLSESARIQWNKGDLRIVDVKEDSVKIKLFDMDMNLNPESVDTVNIFKYSY